MQKLRNKPPFRFVGNKANRRYQILKTFRKVCPNVDCVVDVFGGSLYCSHLAAYARDKYGLHQKSDPDKKLEIITNDYDDYRMLFCEEFQNTLIEMHHITEDTIVPRNERMEPEICARIDELIGQHPQFRQFLRNYLSIYGNIDSYYNRVYVPKFITAEEYIDSDEYISVDYTKVVQHIKKIHGDTKRHLWVCDPPYHTNNMKVNYRSTEEVRIADYVNAILKEFPNDIILNFSYEKAIIIPGTVSVLNDTFIQIAGGVCKTDHEEYTHFIVPEDKIKNLHFS